MAADLSVEGQPDWGSTVESTDGGNVSTAPQQTLTQHDHLLGEIESTEGNLAGLLRPLYDNKEEATFMQSLESRVAMHEKTIEGMCNKHYKGFIDAVAELRQVKSDAMKMKTKIREGDTVIQDTGGHLLKTGMELKQAHSVQYNIYATMESLNNCIPALEMFCQLEKQMEVRQYYEALKTLEQLEHTLLPQISGFSFAIKMKNQIPQTRQAIADLSKNEMTDFLTHVRHIANRVGESAMHQAQRHSKLELSKQVMAPLDPQQKLDPDLCPQDLIDFSPVYRSLHIHSVLGRSEAFQEYYRGARLEQLRLVLTDTSFESSGGSRIDSNKIVHKLKVYLYQIVGFFVVEDTILHTVQGLVTRETLDGLWTMVVSQILGLLTSVKDSIDVYGLLKIKQLIVWFNQTVSGYGCHADKLSEFLLKIRDRYDELQMKAMKDSFENHFSHDNYTQMTVETEDQYQGVLDVFPYRNYELEKAVFPKVFPFSACVPQVYKLLKDFIDQSISYDRDLDISQTELDHQVRKSLNLLLSQTMGHCLSDIIQKPKLTIQQLTQLWVNLQHLEEACPDLEKYISRQTRTDTESMNVTRLYGISTFGDGRHETEDAIIGKFKSKLTAITETAQYNWQIKEVVSSPSQYIEDIVQFISSNFQLLKVHFLSDDFVKRLGTQILKHLAGEIKSILLNPAVLMISVSALEMFEKDVEYCEEYAKTITHLDVQHATGMFSGLRQILDMFLKEEWADFINEYQRRQQKYPYVHPREVHQLLKKLRENEGKKKRTLGFSQSKKDKVKFYDLILKRLQEILDKSEDK